MKRLFHYYCISASSPSSFSIAYPLVKSMMFMALCEEIVRCEGKKNHFFLKNLKFGVGDRIYIVQASQIGELNFHSSSIFF